jgi:parallel beta-helix repeat protein
VGVLTFSLLLISILHADTYVVITTSDTGPGSLRQAIDDANNHAGADTITFNISNTDPGYSSSTGVWTIQPASAFPSLTDDSTYIDGTTQTVNQGNTNSEGLEIEIDGTNAGAVNGFWIGNSSYNTIRGLTINRFSTGINIYGSEAEGTNTIAGNYIGTDPTGKIDMGNLYNGIYLGIGAQHNTIGGRTAADRNVISGNETGIYLSNAGVDSNLIIGNYIGTDVSGTFVIENGRGIELSYGPSANIIGGSDPGERNIISGNHESAVYIHNGCRNNVIIGNYIGTNVTGTDTLSNLYGVRLYTSCACNLIGGTTPSEGNVISGNTNIGILLTGSGSDSNCICGNYIGTDATGTVVLPNREGIDLIKVQYTIIGGNTPEERNLISGNNEIGINISQSVYNIIIGNYIGTDISGSNKLGNGYYGIQLTGGDTYNNIIGGLNPGEGNFISANGSGIVIYGSHNDSNVVEGNWIGTDFLGTGDLGNINYGVLISLGAINNRIGPANTIHFNERDGVAVMLEGSTGNTVTQNSITSNDMYGIYNHTGGNMELTPPAITVATSLSVSGTAPPNSIVEIFSDSTDEGAIYEGTTTADASGNFIWSGSAVGPNVTVTATDGDGNTSQSSSPVIMGVEINPAVSIPKAFTLSQNAPNPFNPSTTIRFSFREPCRVILNIYDLMGRFVSKIINARYQPGEYEVLFNAKGLSSGIYFYRIEMEHFKAVKKMVLLD